jgi:hypothetical protein
VPEETASKYLFDLPGLYQIRVVGMLEERWLAQLEDLEITTALSRNKQPVTQFTGWLADQPALAGLLDLLTELGMVILTVSRLEMEDEAE